MELIFEVVIEVLLWVGGELVIENLARLIGGDAATRPQPPALRLCGLFVLGAVVGAMSQLILGDHVLKEPWLRLAGLALIPIASGALLELWVRVLAKLDIAPRLLTGFLDGLVFSFGISLVRFFAA